MEEINQPSEQTKPMDTSSPDDIQVVVNSMRNAPGIPPTKYHLSVSSRGIVGDLREKIAECLQAAPEEFDIQLSGKKNPNDEIALLDLGLSAGRKTVVFVSLKVVPEVAPKDLSLPTFSSNRAASTISPNNNGNNSNNNNGALVPYAGGNSSHNGSTTTTTTHNMIGPTMGGIGYSNFSSSSYSNNTSSWNSKSSSGFVGLSNQGATCYMNSLIQSLFMTPEFRLALYKWNFEETFNTRQQKLKNEKEVIGTGEGTTTTTNTTAATPTPKPETATTGKETPFIGPTKPKTEEEMRLQFEKDSIPRQLQLLFSRLQLRDQRAVKTKNLTASFGWTDADAFTQHDVQELCRVLFDALEIVLKGTEQESLITDLYQGQMKDYVLCKECNNESSRVDKYLDVPLVIKGFGSAVPVSSVEEALEKFITPEVLEGDNQYSCEKCKKKVDATKGLQFVKFPYLLTLQLKRFDFDYETMRRVKLNYRVSFPFVLNLNSYLGPRKQGATNTNTNANNSNQEQQQPQQSDSSPTSSTSTTNTSTKANETSTPKENLEEISLVDNARSNSNSPTTLPNQAESSDEDMPKVNFQRAVGRDDDEDEEDPRRQTTTTTTSAQRNNNNHHSQQRGRTNPSPMDIEDGSPTVGAGSAATIGADDAPSPHNRFSGDHMMEGTRGVGGHRRRDSLELMTMPSYQTQRNNNHNNFGRMNGFGNYHNGHSNNGHNNNHRDSENQLKIDEQNAPNAAAVKKQIETALKDGPNVYELYAVLIHRGSAAGGHYFAYIKSLDNDRWYEFNDSSVSEISEKEVVKAFGDEIYEENSTQRVSSSSRMYSMFSSSSSAGNAYMLMYRQVESTKNAHLPTKTEIPETLRKHIEAEVQKSKEKKAAKQREREMVNIKLIYGNATKEFKVHNSKTIGQLLNDASTMFELQAKYPLECLRFRNVHYNIDIAVEPLAFDSYEKTIDQMHWYNKSLVLEAKEPGTEFPTYNPSQMPVKVIFYDSNVFHTPRTIWVERDGKLSDLRKVLETEFNVPADKQRLVRESYTFYSSPPWVIIENTPEENLKPLWENRISEGSKIYVEFCDNPETPSPSATEIERTKNLIEIKYNIIGNDEPNQLLQLSKKTTVSQLRQMLSEKLNVVIDEFRIFRGTTHWKQEIFQEKQTLEDSYVSDGTRLFLEKGKALKDGEIRVTFLLFRPEKLANAWDDLFEFPVHDSWNVQRLKEELSKKFVADKLPLLADQPHLEASYIRIREITSKSPVRVLLDSQLVFPPHQSTSSRNLAVQFLAEPEKLQSEGEFAGSYQQWFPSKYQLGPRIETIWIKETTFGQFRQFISEKYQIPAENIGIATYGGAWPGPIDPLEVPDSLRFDSQEMDHRVIFTVISHGDIIYWKDNTEQLKQLTKEEKRKLEQESQVSKRRQGYTHTKEEALHIQTKV